MSQLYLKFTLRASTIQKNYFVNLLENMDYSKTTNSRDIAEKNPDENIVTRRSVITTCRSSDILTRMAGNVLLTSENIRETLDSIDTILTDCDGKVAFYNTIRLNSHCFFFVKLCYS